MQHQGVKWYEEGNLFSDLCCIYLQNCLIAKEHISVNTGTIKKKHQQLK